LSANHTELTVTGESRNFSGTDPLCEGVELTVRKQRPLLTKKCPSSQRRAHLIDF
ncbi:hypothetical protein ATANTOWER_007026, partial [Ataeniobius toweri]|nr:hypothetical protein [Ataeniobius toweri]